MRELRTCDFCGDDAAGLYEPYPPSVPDGPRLLLCSSCRDRLSSVVDPLVAALERGAEEPPVEPDPAASRPADTESPDGGGDSSVAEPGNDAPSPGTTDHTPDADSGPGADGGAPAADPPEEADVSESRDASGRSQGERAGAPPGYRKVMRFLENRQLPMDRTDAEQLAADAYELAEPTVADAIDHAVRYGRLREVNGELKG